MDLHDGSFLSASLSSPTSYLLSSPLRSPEAFESWVWICWLRLDRPVVNARRLLVSIFFALSTA